MATLLPGSAVKLRSWMMVLSGRYPNLTWSNSTFPLTCSIEAVLEDSSSISSSPRNSNTLSPAAAADWMLVLAWAIRFSGDVNNLTYIMNDTMVPISAWPWTISTDPVMQTATYPRFPTNPIRGIIMPEKNWLFHALL